MKSYKGNTNFMTALLLLSFYVFSYGQDAKNIDLFGTFDRGDDRYSGSWIYNAPNGEYALLGTSAGTAIYSMDDSNNIEELAFIPGPKSNWREITVMGNYAYVVTEGKDPAPVGMQVIDLRSLPDTATLLTNYKQSFKTGHIIQRDIYSESPVLYIAGTDNTKGVHIIDVSNPRSPKELGVYNPGYYIHDVFIKSTIMVASAFNEATYDVVLILEPDNLFVLGRVQDPNGFCHSVFETEDNDFLITCSERDGLPARILDIRKEPVITLAATYTSNPKGLVHNVYIKDSFAIFSHNTEGLRIVDILDPTNPVEVGHYDTYDGPAGGFHGLWSACPFSKSGKIIGGNREDGLYIWHFDTLFAGRFYGRVFDSQTQAPIFNAKITINPDPNAWNSDLQGRFKGGALPGDYTLKFTANNYNDFEMEIKLGEKDSLTFDVFLDPYPVSTYSEEGYNIDVFPTVFIDNINIKSNDELYNTFIHILNSNGQLVSKQNYQPSIETNKLSFGTYFIQLFNDQNKLIYSQKVIKL